MCIHCEQYLFGYRLVKSRRIITMQKSLIIVLAVCLLSVNAFVKRDAPAAEANNNYLEDIQKQFGTLSKQVADKLKESLDPEELKKGFNDAINSLGKAIQDIKAKSEAPKTE